MMKATMFPMSDLHIRPAFWGVDRDLKEVIDNIENEWAGVTSARTTEFKETEQAYLLSVDMPGVNKSTLNITVEGESISIVGERKSAFTEGEGEKTTVRKRVLLPKHVDKDKIEAHYEDGVLYIAFPKIEQVKPRKIEIAGINKSTWKNLLSGFKKEN